MVAFSREIKDPSKSVMECAQRFNKYPLLDFAVSQMLLLFIL